MINPYVSQRRTAAANGPIDRRTGAPAVDEFRNSGNGSRIFSDSRNSNGDREINASSRRDLLSKIAELQAAVSRGDILTRGDGSDVQERFAEFKSAYEDRSQAGSERFRVLGEVN
jgi:hypothetical protein